MFGQNLISGRGLWEVFHGNKIAKLSYICGRPEGKFLVTKLEFTGIFCMSLEVDCHEVEVTPNLELLVTIGMSLEGVCHELYT